MIALRRLPMRIVAALAAVAAAIALPGCSSDDPAATKDPPRPEWDVAASPGAGDAPTIRADASRVRDTFAMLPAPDSRYAQSAGLDKRQLKQKTAVRSTRKHTRQIIQAARQRQFAWFGFGFRTW